MKKIIGILLIIFISSCKEQAEEIEVATKTPTLDQVVVISRNAPGIYPHLIKQDSLGKTVTDSIGPKLFLPDYGFTYLNDQDIVTSWMPKKGQPDTLVISNFTEYLELTSYNPFTSIKETFLVKKGIQSFLILRIDFRSLKFLTGR